MTLEQALAVMLHTEDHPWRYTPAFHQKRTEAMQIISGVAQAILYPDSDKDGIKPRPAIRSPLDEIADGLEAACKLPDHGVGPIPQEAFELQTAARFAAASLREITAGLERANQARRGP